MRLRTEQMEAFAEAACREFVERMVSHIRSFFPDQYQTIGAAKVREVVQEGLTRAASYGLEVERHVCMYIELIFAFGADFDHEQPWAFTILNDTERLPAMRLQRLHRAAVQQRHEAKGLAGKAADIPQCAD